MNDTSIAVAPPPAPAPPLPGERTIILPPNQPLIFHILRVVSLNQCCRQRGQTTKGALALWDRVLETIFHPSTGCARGYSRWADRNASKLKKLVFSSITFFDGKYHDSIADGTEPSEIEELSHQLQSDLDQAKAGRTQANNEIQERQHINDREERRIGMMPPTERGVAVPNIPGMEITQDVRDGFAMLARNPRCKFMLYFFLFDCYM